MRIFVDADSCPKPARELAARRAAALGIDVLFAANRPIPGIEKANMEVCPAGDNSADNRIVELAREGDLVISRDIPLAKRLVETGALVLDDRGRVFTRNNINELLSLRNFTVNLADNGMGVERKPGYGKKELKAFADSLDRVITKVNSKK